MAQSRGNGRAGLLPHGRRNATGRRDLSTARQHCGAPVRAHGYCRFDATVKGWAFTSSLWRSPWSSTGRMVSFQRTARLVSGTPTRKRLACWTGSAGLAGDWRRRDVTNGEHIESGGESVWKTVTGPECDGLGQIGGTRLNWVAHSPASSRLQARRGGNALGSQPSLIEVPL